MRRLLPAALLLALLAPAGAHEATGTLVFRSQPVALGPFAVERSAQIVPSPPEDGYVTAISADLLGADGAVEPASHVMLHHVVLSKLGAPDATCSSFTRADGERTRLSAQRFYAEGEERTRVELPPGYGYPNRVTDRWALVAMLMNHRAVRETVTVR